MFAIVGNARNSNPLLQVPPEAGISDYTVGLALFDFLPVLAAGIGLHLLCRYVLQSGTENRWTLIIPALAVMGGTLKASWKLNVVLSGHNIVWMSDQLFFFIAASYLLLAVAVIRGLRARTRNEELATDWWRVPLIIVLVVTAVAIGLKFSSTDRHWSLLLLIVMSTSNLVFAVRLIGHSFALRNWVALTGFVLNLGLTYVLVGLARIPEQTAELQWIEEILNLLSNSLLAIAAYSLIKRANGENNID